MSTKSLWRVFNSRKVKATHFGNFLLSRRHFRAAVHRERLRADRNLNQFTLLTLSFGSQLHNAHTFQSASSVVEQRIRETDTAGWFAKRTLGIILPDTPGEGAWKLADDLSSLLAKCHLCAATAVYDYPSFDFSGPELPEDEVAEPLLTSYPEPRSTRPLSMLFIKKLPIWKRTVDIVGASVGLLLASPVMCCAALSIKLTSPGPIFFMQHRDGLGGQKFQICKFRTMVAGADDMKSDLRAISEQDGPAFKLRNDPRVTRIGQFLRSTSIDELPQLINVLKGEMSLVGPRPLPCDESAACANWQKQRLGVTPGLTCIWQVKGRSRVTFNEWCRMDIEYINECSPWNDVKLLFTTIPAVLFRKGAS